MISVNFICLGKLNEEFFRSAMKEYTKRLGGFCKVSVVELSEAIINEKNAGEKSIEAALAKEGVAILAALPKKTFLVALCIEGEQFTSEELAKWISNSSLQGESNISFVIGSSHGLCDTIKNRADLKLSFSRMTFPHQLMRIMLCEQVYRAFTINAGTKYHK